LLSTRLWYLSKSNYDLGQHPRTIKKGLDVAVLYGPPAS